MFRQTVKVFNPHEKKEETYEGVAVRELLRRAGIPQNDKLRGAAMAMYVVAEASDGYRVVYSLAELILGRRMVDAVTLVQALGGGWNSSEIPQRPECCGRFTMSSK